MVLINSRPLLAARESPQTFPRYFEKLQYPLYVSPKLDGIRARAFGSAISRTGKLLPSFQVQSMFSGLKDLDGELIEGDPTDLGVYNRTESYVTSQNKPGDITFWVFDHFGDPLAPFSDRLELAKETVTALNLPWLHPLEHRLVFNMEELLEAEDVFLGMGFEGVMLRSPVGHYKNGRSTFNEGILLKLKRFEDTELPLVDILEGFVNNNAKKTDELGYTKRSSSKENKAPSGMAGKYIVNWLGTDIPIAPGNFTHAERVEHLANKEKYLSLPLKFRYFKHGMKDLPRHGRALGFRRDQ